MTNSAGDKNWAMAFMQYCRGLPLGEVAALTDIPLEKLEKRAGVERWAILRSEAPNLLPIAPEKAGAVKDLRTAERLAMMRANRDENYRLADELRRDAADAIAKLRTGTKLKQYFFSSKSSQVVEHDVEWSIKDRLMLAQYVETIARISYQALGDASWTGKMEAQVPGAAQGVPQITLVLPGLAAEPREKAADVIDVTDTTDKSS